MSSESLSFEVVVRDIEHEGMTFDVRCFLVPHASGLVLIDTGLPGAHGAIGPALGRLGAAWDDITDIVLTHKHFDHVAGLSEVIAAAPDAVVWVGAEDRAEIPVGGEFRALVDGETVRDLRVIATPGHTPGHRSLAMDDAGWLFAGDAVGSMGGVIVRGPEGFTADAAQAERSLTDLSGSPWRRVLFAHGAEVTDPASGLRRLVSGSVD